MIGSGLKKLAKENGMKVAHGVAYGSLRGYAATLSEGANYKQIVFTTVFTDPAGKGQLLDAVNRLDLKKAYRVLSLNLAPNAVVVVFHDTIGTMKKIEAFLDWFIPMLESHGAAKYNICTECGCEIVNGKWALINGAAFHFHDSCAQKVQREVADENTQKKENAEGSYISGTLGAFLGAALGAVAWAIVLNLGYVASLVGLLIGWLADMGYNLLKGKQGKAKVAILILAVIFGVVAGTLAADVMTLTTWINNGELPGYTYADIPVMMGMLFADSEYISAMVSNIGMGLLFAALGVFALLRNTGKAVADSKYIALN